MATNNNKQQPGPIAQQLTKFQSNGHQTPSNGQQLLTRQLPKRTSNWTGFSGRTLWDWIQFFAVLALPIIVAVGTLYFTQQITQQQAQSSITANERQHQTDIQIEEDQQQEAVLQGYLDRISDLLLTSHLHESKPGDEVRNVARAQTLTTLRRLDGDRKVLLIQFLYQAQLISAPGSASDYKNPVISLVGADLSGVQLDVSSAYTPLPPDLILASELLKQHPSGCSLRNIDLSGTDLSGASFICQDLTEADLSGANLFKANLQVYLYKANLSGANLGHADLQGANLSGADLQDAYLCDYSPVPSEYLDKCTDLTFANLSETDLRGIDFDGVDLSSANLKGAIISSNQINQVASLQGTIMPDGSTHP